MAKLVKITGVQAVIKALKKGGERVAKGTERGVKKAGLFLQRESQKVVPVDTGDLKRSADTRVSGKGFDTEALVTYTQEYAIYVHEDTDAEHRPGKIAKFLEKPARDNRKKFQLIIRREASK